MKPASPCIRLWPDFGVALKRKCLYSLPCFKHCLRKALMSIFNKIFFWMYGRLVCGWCQGAARTLCVCVCVRGCYRSLLTTTLAKWVMHFVHAHTLIHTPALFLFMFQQKIFSVPDHKSTLMKYTKPLSQTFPFERLIRHSVTVFSVSVCVRTSLASINLEALSCLTVFCSSPAGSHI